MTNYVPVNNTILRNIVRCFNSQYWSPVKCAVRISRTYVRAKFARIPNLLTVKIHGLYSCGFNASMSVRNSQGVAPIMTLCHGIRNLEHGIRTRWTAHYTCIFCSHDIRKQFIQFSAVFNVDDHGNSL